MKSRIEIVLQDFCHTYGMNRIALRYFNPIGANPKLHSVVQVQFPSHVLAKLLETALSEEAIFNITVVNLLTHDHSGIRDAFGWDAI